MKSAKIVDANIETLEVGSNFVVISGWIAVDGSIDTLELSIFVEKNSAKLGGYFERRDIRAPEGVKAHGFCIDMYLPGKVKRSTRIGISSEQGDFEFEVSDVGVSDFKCRGAFDPGNVEYVAGWLYDPSSWYEAGVTSTVITVGDVTIPLSPNLHRYDLPISAARTGRELGFQLSVKSYAAEVLRLSAAGFDTLSWLMTKEGIKIAQFDTSITEVDVERLRLLGDMAPGGLTSGDVGVPFNSLAVTVDHSSLREDDKGFIDYWGYSPGLRGWIVGGWASTGSLGAGECEVTGIFGTSRQSYNASFITYSRADVIELGVGFIMFLPGDRVNFPLERLVILEENSRFSLRRSDVAREVDEVSLLHEARNCVRQATNERSEKFKLTIERPVFDGSDTISSLGPSVQIGIDEVMFAADCGVVLIGWFLDPTHQVCAVRLRKLERSEELLDRWVSSERPDIKQAFGSALGLTHSRWGFTTFGPVPAERFAGYYLEIELKDGRIGHRAVPAPTRDGIAAINRILHDVVLSQDTILKTCKTVLADPIKSINRGRLKDNVEFLVAQAGEAPDGPRASIIIPLYGRLDFLSYQAALFDRNEHANDEFIYVLDQPERKEEFLELARLAHIKTGMPFRLLLPSQNLGFAGASNLGLKAARGKFICFLNSDVMPGARDWMSTLVDTMISRPDLGVLSTLLLFEDETVQHAGMDFERHRQFGNMLFPFHPGKGRFNVMGRDVKIMPAVTGACMVMERTLCTELGGFDEDYIIGDFEDADLCMKVRAKGLHCAVHNGVTLYHLERQSQTKAANRARMNLTLLNAWTFAQRWDQAELATDDSAAVLKIA